MNKPKHLIISRVPVFHYTYRAASFGLNNIFYLESQAERLVSKVGQGRKKLGSTFGRKCFCLSRLFPYNRLGCLRQLSADARCWGINTAHWQHCLYFRSIQDVEAATYLWNIYSRVPSYIGSFPPLSMCVSVCLPTRLCWAKTSLRSGKAVWFNTHRGRRGQEGRDRCISPTVKKKKDTGPWNMHQWRSK